MATANQTPRRDLFGDVAVAKKLLTWAQVRDALKRQLKYKEMGIAVRIGEVTIELGLLTQANVNDILTEQAERRRDSQAASKPAEEEGLGLDDSTEDGEPVQLGPYSLEKRLGGVMGIVYRGVDTQTKRTVALKVLPRHLAHEMAFVERFKREVRATSILSHPNIVQVYDAGVIQGVFYLATEFIDGETLNQRLRRDKYLPEADVLQVAGKVALALAHAHEKDVLHRDVKPENIMVAKNGDVKLADFGLAKMLADEQRITADGIAVGTPHYIAPEQARALKETDHRADLYGLGATLFHLLTGRLPYEGDDGAEIMRRHVFDEVPDPLSVKADMTPAVSDMVRKLMAKAPGDRFQTAIELAQHIEKLAGNGDPSGSGSKSEIAAPAGDPRGTSGGMPRKRFTP
jgi:eukaryotic-like serine/threonine-protein kinase